MPHMHYTLRQHMAAVLSVLALSIVMSELVELGTDSLGRAATVETPMAEDLGGIPGPAAAGWGRTVLRLSGIH